MKGVISTDASSLADLQAQLDAWGGMVGRNLAEEVCGYAVEVAHTPNPVATVNVIDARCKQNIVRLLSHAIVESVWYNLGNPSMDQRL